MGKKVAGAPLTDPVYTLDTNAIIYYLKDDAEAVSVLRDIFKQDVPLYVSAITELELFGFSHLGFDEEERIDGLLKTVAVIPVDSRLARIAGSLRRRYGLRTSDSAIAATALFTATTLLSRNTRDFRKVPNLLLRRV